MLGSLTFSLPKVEASILRGVPFLLKDLGVSSIRLMASRERHYVGLEGFGIRISETEIV